MIDYRIALSRWLAEPAIDRIVFCENSGTDLELLRYVAAQDKVHDQEIIFVSYSAPEADGKYGKGYGEMGILKHLLSKQIFSYSDSLLKVTGRYSIDNFDSILSDIRSHGDADIITPAMNKEGFIHSECFYSRVAFLDRYLIRKQEMINDVEGRNFEHVLAQAVAEAVRDNAKHAVFSERPYLVGISGGTNLPLRVRRGPTGVEVPLTPDYVAFFRATLCEYLQQLENNSERAMYDDVLKLLTRFPKDISEIPSCSLSNMKFTYADLHVLCNSVKACLREVEVFSARTGFSVSAGSEVARAIEKGLQEVSYK